jgi:hypothetical protein
MPVVEDLPRLELRRVRSLPQWKEMTAAGAACLELDLGAGPVHVKIHLASDVTLWGRRWWFQCPECASWRRHLYLHDGRLSCRCCHRALYYRQRLPDSAFRAEWERPLFRQVRSSTPAPGFQ